MILREPNSLKSEYKEQQKNNNIYSESPHL